MEGVKLQVEYWVDTREPLSIHDGLKALLKNVRYRKLDSGDIQGRRIVIERKTLQDLYNSIVSQHRFHNQIEEFVAYAEQHELTPMMLIHGSFNDFPKSLSINYNVIYGAIASVAVRYGIRTVFYVECDNKVAALNRALRIAAKVLEKESLLDIPHRRPSRSTQVAFIRALLRVPQRTATELLRRFGSIRRILLASDDELLSVPGIGKATLRRIHCILDGR